MTSEEEIGPEVNEPWGPLWDGRTKLSAVRELSPQEEEKRRLFRSLSDPQEVAEQLMQTTSESLRRNFQEPVIEVDPNTGNRMIFELVGDLDVEEPRDPWDYTAIRRARLDGRTYGSRVRGTFRIREEDPNGKTLRTLDEKTRTLALIPTPTYDRSFVVKGKPRTLQTQFRRKPGVFTDYNAAGALLTEFNVDHFTDSKVKNFKIRVDQNEDDKGPEFYVEYGGAKKIPAWDLAQAMGATAKDLEKAVGKETAEAVLSRASPKRYERTVRNLHTRVLGDKERAQSPSVSVDDLQQELQVQFGTAGLDPDITKATIGVDAAQIDKRVLLNSFRKLKRVATKEETPDDRESLALKMALSPSDLIAEAVGRDPEVNKFRRSTASKLRSIKWKVRDAEARGEKDPYAKIDVTQFISGQFNPKIESKLTRSMLQQSVSSVNPLDTLSASTQTTIMGEGAITSDRGVPSEAKLISPSSLGFIDPVHTPESDRAGVNLNLSGRARVRPSASGKFSELATTVFDKQGREVELTPAQMLNVTLGSPDQFEMRNGRPVAKGGRINAFRAGEPVEVAEKDVDYWMPDYHNVFDVISSLIPYMNSAQGNRVQYADKQITASVPLLYREEPLVQVKAPNSNMTMEELLGEEAGAVHAPFDGKVVDIVDRGVDERYMMVQKKGSRKPQRINLPKNIATGGHTPLDATPVVQKGDSFSRGDTLADSTFTRNGKLALGVNLRTAYLPYSSATFEDALVVSESAARKMTSEHIYEEARDTDNLRLSKKEFLRRSTGNILTNAERDKLGEDGVVKVGQIVKPGETLIVGTRGIGHLDRAEQVQAIRQAAELGVFSSKDKRNLKHATVPFQHTWKSEYEGEVVDVKKGKDGAVRVFVKTREPFQAGDKLFGRHGNKGVAARVIPDEEMPYNPSMAEVINPGASGLVVGQEIPAERAERLAAKDPSFEWKQAHLELLMNPLGIPSRLNPSQNFETFTGKIAKREGKPQLVENFAYDSNWDEVSRRLSDAGVSDKEDLVDPVSGRKLEGIGVGTQYITKAKQSVAHKSDARGTGRWTNKGLASRSSGGAQALGELGVYSLISQDAREFLRDAQVYKSENREEVWKAIEEGRPLPVYRNPEDIKALGRFRDYLTAAGVNMHHDPENHRFVLRPLTDKNVVEMTKGADGADHVIPQPTEVVRKRTNELTKGGLFDPEITGGMDGNRWARFELATPLPNPVYEKPIRDILGLRKEDYEKLSLGLNTVEVDGKELSGSQAIQAMLQTVDLKAVRERAEKTAREDKRPSIRSRAYRTIKSIEMLEKEGLRPDEAFMRQQIAVAPPALRSIDTDEDGNIVYGDLNYLYRDIALANTELKKAQEAGLPPKALARLEKGLYDSVRTLMHTEGSAPLSGDFQGVLGTIAGLSYNDGEQVSDVKNSLFKKELVDRRQAFSARTVLAPDDTLGLDDAAIPYNMAATIMEPHIMAEWNRKNPGAGTEERTAFLKKLQDYSKDHHTDTEIESLVNAASKDKAFVLKRDPALHRYAIQAFHPKFTHKGTVSMNPLVYSGFGADNDGDTMGIFMPLSQKANDEAFAKMLPSKNLLNPAHGGLEYGVGHESLLGITRATKKGAKTNKSFTDIRAAKEAYDREEIKINDEIRVAGKTTTLGRVQFEEALPRGMDLETLKRDGLLSDRDLEEGIGKKALNRVLENIATASPGQYGQISNTLRVFGQEQATYTGSSVIMDDIKPLLAAERKKAEKDIKGKVAKINANRSLSDKDRSRQIEATFAETIADLDGKAEKEWRDQLQQERPNTLTQMVNSGARAKFHQLKQITVAPIALVDGSDSLVPFPVMRNYSDGLDPAGYWTAASGARKGATSKVQEVRDPGFLSKQILNTTMDQVISEPDCKTTRGISLDLNDKANHKDLAGRVLTAPVSVRGVSLSAGSTMTLNHVTDLSRHMKDGASLQLKVRSPQTCESDAGICQKCAGGDLAGTFHPIGTNFGTLSGQALGERATQLTISTFHGGGVFQPGVGSAANLFDRTSALLRMPGSMGGDRADVATSTSAVSELKKDANRGGWGLSTEDGTKYFIPFGSRAPDGSEIESYYQKGTTLTRGRPITEGLANPKDILDATGNIEDVQNYLSDELGGIFAGTGVSRRNVEGVVRSMTNTVEVTEPAGVQGLVVGERIPLQQAKKLAQKHPQFRYRSILRGVDVAPRELNEDFLAQLNFNNIRGTLTDAAAKGAQSDYHSHHPIPALATGFITSPWMNRRLKDRGAY